MKRCAKIHYRPVLLCGTAWRPTDIEETWTQIQNQTCSLYGHLQFMWLRGGWLMAVQFPLTACSTQVSAQVFQNWNMRWNNIQLWLRCVSFPPARTPTCTHALYTTDCTIHFTYLYIKSDSFTFNTNTPSYPNDPIGQLPRILKMSYIQLAASGELDLRSHVVNVVKLL